MKLKKLLFKSNKIAWFIGLIVIAYLLVVAVRSIGDSLLLEKRDRINLLIYREEPVVLSLDLSDNVSYLISFSNTHKIYAPGGYKLYRIGSLGKLAYLEKDYDLLRRTFSHAISAYIDVYVAEKNPPVYSSSQNKTKNAFKKTQILSFLLKPSNRSNSSFLDRLYLGYLIMKKPQIDFIALNKTFTEKIEGEITLDERGFAKYYQGYFYDGLLRKSSSEVKLKYSKYYRSALYLSQIIEGQGIRVVDIEKMEENEGDECLLLVDRKQAMLRKQGLFGSKLSSTVRFLKKKYKCKYRMQDVEDVDIIMIPGKNLEEVWR